MTRSRSIIVQLVAACALVSMAATAAAVPGQSASQQSRRTVWDGVYTDAQALRGRASYEQACLSCHRDDLRGDSTAPSLVGVSFMFLWGDMALAELVTRMQKVMPPERPGSLPAQTYVDIAAYILHENSIPTGNTELSAEPGALDILITPNRP